MSNWFAGVGDAFWILALIEPLLRLLLVRSRTCCLTVPWFVWFGSRLRYWAFAVAPTVAVVVATGGIDLLNGVGGLCLNIGGNNQPTLIR